MAKVTCPICKKVYHKGLFNLKVPNNMINGIEFEGMTPVDVCPKCIGSLMSKAGAYFDAFLSDMEDKDFSRRLTKYMYANTGGVSKLEEERIRYQISSEPIAEYDYFNIKMKLYPASKSSGKFMITESSRNNGYLVDRYYVFDAGSTVVLETRNDTKVDGSQVDKAFMLGLAGGSFLGYIAATAAKVYDVVEDFSLTILDTQNGKKAKLLFAPKNQKMTTEVYNEFSTTATAFIQALIAIVG